MNARPQIIHAPGGEELVVLSRAEYDALVALAEDAEEDAADLEAYDRRKAALATGEDEVLPAEVTAGLLRGESRLKAIRKWRGLKQVELAERAGLGQGYLSDLERGDRKGAPETLRNLAEVLDVDHTWLS